MAEASTTTAAATVLSVVIPMYNEEEVLPALVSRLRPVLAGLGVEHEVVAVDDGSTDRTAELLAAFRLGWPQLRVIGLRRNSGHQAALTAGLDRAVGAYVVSIDADLQDPPEKIPDMLDAGPRREPGHRLRHPRRPGQRHRLQAVDGGPVLPPRPPPGGPVGTGPGR